MHIKFAAGWRKQFWILSTITALAICNSQVADHWDKRIAVEEDAIPKPRHHDLSRSAFLFKNEPTLQHQWRCKGLLRVERSIARGPETKRALGKNSGLIWDKANFKSLTESTQVSCRILRLPTQCLLSLVCGLAFACRMGERNQCRWTCRDRVPWKRNSRVQERESSVLKVKGTCSQNMICR